MRLIITADIMEQIIEETQDMHQQKLNPDEEQNNEKPKKDKVRTEMRNKQVECKVCSKIIRSDTVKHHMNIIPRKRPPCQRSTPHPAPAR